LRIDNRELLTLKIIFIMNKAQLIDAMASEAKISKADAKKALDAFIKTTSDVLKNGDRLALVGFGSFSVSERSARTGRNPQTGKPISIEAKKVVKFKPGSELGDAVN
jgi:DNA-binding protein HU-beta